MGKLLGVLLIGVFLVNMVSAYTLLGLYKETRLDSELSFKIPGIITIVHVGNKVADGYVWGFIRISGLINAEGWLPLCEYKGVGK